MKVAIGVTYSGAGMEGWQSQPSGNTVQDHLARALSEISGEPITVTGAGRTDAGVHASAQVAHFETSVERPESAWVRGANSLLPDGIAVQWVTAVAGDFHARYSALSRSYRYVLYNHPVRPALLAGRTGWFHAPLDLDMVRNIVGCLVYVGKGNQAPQWISELIAAQDRRLAAPTFTADGLYLFGVR